MAIISLEGRRYGALLVQAEHRQHKAPSGSRTTMWRCLCDCGREAWVGSPNLTRSVGATRSCGCLRATVQAERMRQRHARPSLAGERFELLTVDPGQSHGIKRTHQTMWRCICDCGSETWVTRTDLTGGRSRSCGCARITNGDYRRDAIAGEIPRPYWTALRNRATSRGLAFEVAPERAWELFLGQERRCALSGQQLDFRPGSNCGHTASLDRIDSSEPYRDGNVQWLHKDINMLKSDLPESQFVDLCRLVAQWR